MLRGFIRLLVANEIEAGVPVYSVISNVLATKTNAQVSDTLEKNFSIQSNHAILFTLFDRSIAIETTSFNTVY